jgi:hypothetical protein
VNLAPHVFLNVVHGLVDPTKPPPPKTPPGSPHRWDESAGLRPQRYSAVGRNRSCKGDQHEKG